MSLTKKLLAGVAVAALAVGAGALQGASPALAGGNEHYQQRWDRTGWAFNTCDGREVVLQGVAHIESLARANGSEQTTVNFHAANDSYVLNQIVHVKVDRDPSFSYSESWSLVLVSKGPGPNLLLDTRAVWTPTGFAVTFEERCVG